MLATIWKVNKISEQLFVAKEIQCGEDGMCARVDRETGKTFYGTLDEIHEEFKSRKYVKLKTKFKDALEVWTL